LGEQAALIIKSILAFRACGSGGCIGPGNEVSKPGPNLKNCVLMSLRNILCAKASIFRFQTEGKVARRDSQKLTEAHDITDVLRDRLVAVQTTYALPAAG
jgi:hypothetical protein